MFGKSAIGMMFAALAGTSVTAATTYEVNTVSRGCLSDESDFCAGSGTPFGIFYTGELSGPGGLEGVILHSFFGFDLSGIGGTVISGEVYIEIDPDNGYSSDDASEGIGFYTISDESLGKILDGTSNLDNALHADLGTGLNLGGTFVTPTDVAAGSITYSMGAQWISALNNSIGGDFGFGGRLFTTTINDSREGIFGGSGTGSEAFILRITTDEISDVPLPAGLPMLIAGMSGLGVLRRRQGRH